MTSKQTVIMTSATIITETIRSSFTGSVRTADIPGNPHRLYIYIKKTGSGAGKADV